MNGIDKLCGWQYQIADEEYTRLQSLFLPFTFQGDVRNTPGTPIWEIAKKVLGGKLPPTWYQKTGDCVSMGACQAGQYMQLFEMSKRGQEEMFKLWFPPYIYATSRVDIGGGRLGRSAGSTGAWAAQAMQRLGVLFMDDPGVPQYSGDLADDWGYRGAGDRFKKEASDNPVQGAAKLTTVEQIRTALCNYKMVTYAIMWPYDTEPYTAKGKSGKEYPVMKRGREVGGHQVCLLHWNDDIDGAFCLNSWSDRVHGPNLNGEPKGGAYILRRDIERDLGGYSEFYALSDFQGFKGEADYGFV